MVHARDSVCMGSTSQNSTGGAHVNHKITLGRPGRPAGCGPAGARRVIALMVAHKRQAKPEGAAGSTEQAALVDDGMADHASSDAPASAGPALPRLGSCLFPAIVAANGVSAPLSQLAVLMTFFSLLALPALPTFLAHLGIDSSWDSAHELENSWGFPVNIMGLLEHGCQLNAAQVQLAAALAGAVFGLLATADLLSGCCPQAIRWPQGWNTNNTQCYAEMFCEPTRQSLIRRPGNCYSNILYLFAGVIVLMSSWQQREAYAFCVADAIFGVMLVMLAAMSVIWHASNCPASHYVDLWSMDSCIAYLIIRLACLGAFVFLHTTLGMGASTSSTTAAVICTGLYLLLIFKKAKHQYAGYQSGYLDGCCPFSCRNRLLGKGQLTVCPLHHVTQQRRAQNPVLHRRSGWKAWHCSEAPPIRIRRVSLRRDADRLHADSYTCDVPAHQLAIYL
eukprot:COSAG05_NODE_2198_length_3410_cov_5.345213_3_plen_449_part_00